jgi:hypothetical protein
VRDPELLVVEQRHQHRVHGMPEACVVWCDVWFSAYATGWSKHGRQHGNMAAERMRGTCG